MADPSHTFVCSVCEHTQEKHTDLCNGCGDYKTLKEVDIAAIDATNKKKSSVTFSSLDSDEAPPVVFPIGINEFDRVFGKGLTVGSTIFFTGDPGVGKTTLLLRIVAKLARARKSCVFITGEQSEAELRHYAKRIGVSRSPVDIAFATKVESILGALHERSNVDILVIDSINQMEVSRFKSSAGSTAQIKESAKAFIRFAKRNDIILIMTGHVTKSNQASGPKWVEHAVDVPVHLSIAKDKRYRVLRCSKNRHGPINELGYFKMTTRGLQEAPDYSEDEEVF